MCLISADRIINLYHVVDLENQGGGSMLVCFFGDLQWGLLKGVGVPQTALHLEADV
jgi:hypothetical protein